MVNRNYSLWFLLREDKKSKLNPEKLEHFRFNCTEAQPRRGALSVHVST